MEAPLPFLTVGGVQLSATLQQLQLGLVLLYLLLDGVHVLLGLGLTPTEPLLDSEKSDSRGERERVGQSVPSTH